MSINNDTFSTYLKSIFFRYKIYLCTLFMIAIIGSMFNVVVDYQIKEIIDTIALNQNTNVEELLLIFFL